MISAIVLVMLGSLMPLNFGLIGGSGWTKWELGIRAQLTERLLGHWLSIWVASASIFSAAGQFAALSFSRGQND